MEIRLAQESPATESEVTAITFYDVLTEDLFKEIESSVEAIEELHSLKRLLDCVLLNDEDLLNYLKLVVDDWIKKIRMGVQIDRKDLDGCFLNVNRLFLIYLSSIRTFVDDFETFIKRNFGGETSREWMEWANMKSVFYDNSFAYICFYHLRNYSQHCGMPVGGVKFNLDRSAGNLVKYEFMVVFNRDKLLHSKYEWKKAVRELLESREPEFDIVPLILEMTNNVREMERNAEVILKSRFVEAAKKLFELAKPIKKEGSRIFVAYNITMDSMGKIAGHSGIDIPLETVVQLLDQV